MVPSAVPINNQLVGAQFAKIVNLPHPLILQNPVHFPPVVLKAGQHGGHHLIPIVAQCCTAATGVPEQRVW